MEYPFGGPIYEKQADEMTGWRIYYGNGTEIDSSESTWEDAPSDNVQILMLFFDKPYRNQVCAADTYYLPGGSTPKSGKQIPDEAFYRIQARAVADERWPGE